MSRLTPEQERAVERRDGPLMVRAGAGTGKTAVLVERFVRAVVEDGAGVEQMLAITFTEKAAAEMRARVRARFVELGLVPEARAAESAWISTIHGLCARILRAHALSAGIDPGFRVLDELEAERLVVEAFDGALEEFMAGGEDAGRIELAAAYTPDGLRDMVRTAHTHLRSRGERRPRLPAAPPESACDSDAAADEQRVYGMLRLLLELFDARFERAKRERSGLDFEDLELIARDLLAGDPGLRELYSSRFRHVLVDELQDVNPLQNELLGLLSRDNLFRVGDENQSIYRFRHADVGVFTSAWEAAARAGRAESITVNFRSRAELIDAVDLAFERTWGERYEPLRAAPDASKRAPRATPCVELIAVERRRARWDEALDPAGDPFGASLHGAPPWRAVEARLLAKRVDELTREGPFSPGEVVMLFRATTAMGFFERALEERGIPVHVVGGRGYWGQQQVADLRHWLAALANPLDGLAVYSVLASPLAGLSLDAVALIGLHARRSGRDPWWTVQERGSELERLLPEPDRRKLDTFVERFESERRVAGQVSLETLIDRAVTRTGYDRHLLALPGGTRRMANVRKLMRMAREFEADEGRDLRGFVDALGDRDLMQSREGEAPLEAEALDAVRMMTVHRAKGLEFPVVCLADLGKDGREDDGSLRISDDGSVGLRLASLGGEKVNSERLERIRAEAKSAAEAEERRIFYVAATRAKELLVLSGATDLVKRPEPAELCEPMRWVWRGFCAGLPLDGPPTGIHSDVRDGRPVDVRYTLCTPATVDAVLAPADRAPAAPVVEEPPSFEQPVLELGTPPAPRALPVSRLSYSGLEAYRRCGYRFYLERALRLAPVEPPPPEPGEPALETPVASMTPLLRGSIVHALLELIDFRRPALPPDSELEAAIERHAVPASAEGVADLRGMLERVLGSRLRERIARARQVRAELPFAFTLAPPGAGGRSLLVNGVVDILAREDEGTLVVDWKSDALEGRDPEQVCAESYSTQRLVYALAALRGGAQRVEVVHCFLERPDEPAVAVFDAADAERLEGELLELARGVVEARFEPSAQPHRALCGDCPGQAALCSHEPALTLRADPREAGERA